LDDDYYTVIHAAKYYAIQNVYYVMDLPFDYGDVIGTLTVGDKVKATGICKETGWFRIDYNGTVGYMPATALVKNDQAEPKKVPKWKGEYTFTYCHEVKYVVPGVKFAYLYTEPSSKGNKTDCYLSSGNCVWVV
jgi:uncharacterized protein YgiM (DUF1202 family)